ncbi:MAG: sensor histidine kinase [Betaproteobacteria bacterium]|nr:sensor histidine kinase [Betaproteobacteria bacterium]
MAAILRIFACAVPITQADVLHDDAARLPRAALAFSQRHWRFVAVGMLALLHVVALRGVADDGARVLLIAHLGLVLLWQPLLRGERRVTLAQTVLIGAFAAALVYWLNGWLLAAWTVILAGLVGGRVFLHQARWQRRFYLLMLVYLLALLVVVVLPQIAPRNEIDPVIRGYAAWGLPVLFVAMALAPTETDPPEAAQVIDYFYSVFLMLMLGVVILGCFAFMMLGRTGYLQALTYIVFVIAAVLLAIGLAWNPRTGYAGLSVFVSRYLFSIGLPIEQWLQTLARLSHAEREPGRFLVEAAAALARLPSVQGASWRAAGESGEAGSRTPYPVEFSNEELALIIYSRYRTSPALQGHLRLLGQLLGEFYLAKLRERALRQASYMEAVHETGARVTHDVKNLLQSLNVLCSVALAEGGDSPASLALLRRQLPAVAQRLGATLDKLQRPAEATEAPAPAAEWWESLVRQYADRGVEFSARALEGTELPRGLFDSVADNLLQNALAKRAAEPGVRVSAALQGGDAPALRVRDSGRAVPAALAATLLRAPMLQSAGGLGIGLYQAARQAQAAGWVLRLETNRDGEVCFALERASG